MTYFYSKTSSNKRSFLSITLMLMLSFSYCVKAQYGADNNGPNALVISSNNTFIENEDLKLLDFTFIQNGGNNILYWLTNKDDNVSHYIIESSTSGKQFKYMETIQSKGNLNQLAEYNATLDKEANSKMYYRLKVLDKSEGYYYSKIIQSTPTPKTYYPLFLISHQKLNIFQTDKSNAALHMKISHIGGPLVRTFQLKNTYELSLQGLPKGAYIIHYQNESMKGIWRFVKN